MVAVKKIPPTRTDLEQNFHLDYKESKPPSNLAGFIFLCSNETIPDLESRIFGLPLAHLSSVRAIKQGMPLFLFNYSTRCLCGVFEAASDGGLNLNPCAWENVEVRKLGKAPVSRYPAQVRVNLKFQRPPLDEETFRPILDHVEGHKFRLELTAHQVKRLLRLFAVPEKEFFGEKTKQWPQGIGIGAYLPDSPRSAFKSDSDCYSECSSKGTYYGEDDWIEDDKTGKNSTQVYLAHGNSEPYLSDELSHLSLNGVASTNYKIIDENPGDNELHDTTPVPGMPFYSHGSKITAPHSRQQSALKKNIGRNLYSPWPELLESRDVNQVLSRFHEADPAVNSNPIYASEAGGTQLHSEDEAESLPYVPPHIPSPYLGCEIYFPVQTQPRRSGQKKLAASALASKQGLNSENHDKLLNYHAQKLLHQHYPIYLPGTQYGHVLLPLCAARPGSVYDSNHMATMLSPVLLSPLAQGVTLAHPQLSALDQIEEGQATLSNPQMHAGGYPNFLHNGQFPVLLFPSVIPRVTPSAQSLAGGLIEALHFNILQFTRLTRPSVERQRLVEAAIDSIHSCVRTVWPDADVEVFGSFATGLCLQHSDVDLAVVDAPLLPSLVNMTTSQASSFLLRELGSALKASKCCDSYNVIANASVPVLKCHCRPIVKMSDPSSLVPSVAIDITIGGIRNSTYEWREVFKGTNAGRLGSQQHTGGAAREYVLGKVRELPALAPLVLLMKSFLHHKGLSNVYMGGLGSFSLTLLLAYHLESTPLSEEGAADRLLNNASAAAQIAVSPVSSLSDFAEEFDVPLTQIMGDNFYSSYKSEGVAWSLGEYYVRKAAMGIEKVLAFWDAGGVAPLGKLLLSFLRTFGFERDLAREKIILKGMNGRPGGIVKRDNRHIALWIDDPLRPGVNVAAGSFGMCQVQAAFREMHWALRNGQPLTPPLQCDEKDCQDLCAFAELPQLSRLLTDASDHYEQD